MMGRREVITKSLLLRQYKSNRVAMRHTHIHTSGLEGKKGGSIVWSYVQHHELLCFVNA